MRYFVAAGAGAAALLSVAHALPPIEAYGELPEITSVAIAPDGSITPT